MRCCRPGGCSRATTSRSRPSPGTPSLPVTRRPAVAILPTGGELRPAGHAARPGRGRRCRRPDAAGARARRRARPASACPPCPDDAEEIGAAVLRRRRGERPRARDRGLVARPRRPHGRRCSSATASWSRTAWRCVPAHPVALGVVEGTPVIGVPGYPVAAAIAFERFARPLLELLLGALPEDAPLDPRAPDRRRARQARGGGLRAARPERRATTCRTRCPQSRKGGALRGLAGAHALLCTRLEDGVLPAGSEVDARLLRPWPRARA